MEWKTRVMTSAVNRSKRQQGFTLLEIVIVLVIAVLMMSGALVAMRYSSDERVLRNASEEIEILAKRARMNAILKQTPYALEFREGVVRMMPLANAGRSIDFSNGGPIADGHAGSGGEDVHRLASGMTVSVKRWNSDQWLTTLKEVVHIWRFDPNGLCEPLTVRFNYDKSWEVNTFHPLTATVVDSQMEIQSK